MPNELVTPEEVYSHGIELMEKAIAEHDLNEEQAAELRTIAQIYLSGLTGAK